jgi:hypothetical protein
MVGLSRSERGVYVTVINCIYIEGGPVKDQPFYWASLFDCSEAAWLRDRDALIAKDKLFLAPTLDGLPGLMNARAARELHNQFAFKSEQATRGKKGGSASRKKPRSDKGLSRRLASAKPPLSECLASAKPIETEIEIKNPPYPGKEDTQDYQEEPLGEGVVRFPGKSA